MPRTPKPQTGASSRSRATLPCRLYPKEKRSPSTTAEIPSVPASKSRTKSAAGVRENSRLKGYTTTPSRPSS